jgi:hypothetical protein
MERRTVLRGSLGVAALTVPLAGCSSSDDGTEDDGDDGGDDSPDGTDSTPDGTVSTPDEDSTSDSNAPGVSGDIPGTAGNVPDGLEVVSTAASVEANESDGDSENDLVILVELENVGERETDATNYSYSAEVRNDAGELISDGGGSWSPVEAFTGEIAPGETVTIQFIPTLNGEPENAAEFTLTLECTGFRDGSYCSESTPS